MAEHHEEIDMQQQKKIAGTSKKTQKLLVLSRELVKASTLSELVYLILKCIQSLQILALTKKAKIFEGESAIFINIRFILQYLNFQQLVENHNGNNIQYSYDIEVMTLILGIMVGLLILTLLIFVLLFCLGGNISDQYNGIISVLYKALSTFFVIFRYIMIIPFLLLIAEAFIAVSILQNIQQIIIISIQASVAFILCCIIQFISIFGHPPPSPFNSHPKSCQPIFKYFFTMIFVAILIVLYSLNHIFPAINIPLMYFILMIPLLIVEFSQLQMLCGPTSLNNQFTKNCQKIITFTLAFYGLFILIREYTDIESWSDGLLVYFVIGVFITSVWVFCKPNICLHELTGEKEGNQLLPHYYKLVKIIEGVADLRVSFRHQLIFQGFIGYHIRNCNKPGLECRCRQLPSRKYMSNTEAQSVYYIFLTQLIKNNLSKIEEPESYYLLLAYIYQQRLKNRFQAIYFITKTIKPKNKISKDDEEAQDPSLLTLIRYYQQIKLIEDVMKEQDQKNSVKHQNASIDLNKFLEFHMKLVEFQILLQNSAKKHIMFWKQLLDTRVNLKQLNLQGEEITEQNEKTQKDYENLSKLNSKNVRLMQLYGHYLIYIRNDHQQTSQTLEKAVMINKNLKSLQHSVLQSGMEKYSSNSNTLIIIISGRQESLGEIIQTNKSIAQVLGYTRTSILHQNINTLMPAIFGEHHDQVLSNYLSTSNQKLNNTQRIVTALDAEGYMVPVVALTKAIPDLTQGIRIVGYLSLFKDVDQDLETSQLKDFRESTAGQNSKLLSHSQIKETNVSYILYECNSEVVMGISRECSQKFGIPKSLVYGDKKSNNLNELKLKNIFGVVVEKIEDNAISRQKLVLQLETRNLSKQFLIANDGSEQQLQEGNKKRSNTIKSQVSKAPTSKQGKRAKIVVKSIFNTIYNGIPLRLVQIFESPENFHEFSDTRQLRIERGVQSKNSQLLFASDNKIKKDQDRQKVKETIQENLIDEDNNNLKQFKSFISLKNQPNAIKFINCFCIILIFVVLTATALSIWDWNYKLTIHKEKKAAKQLAYKNRVILSEILHEIEKLYISKNDKFARGELLNRNNAQQRIKYLWREAKYNQLNLLTYKNNQKFGPLMTNNYVINVTANQGGGINNFKTQEIQLDYSIILWLSKVNDIINSDHSYLKPYPANFSSLIVNNYYEIKYTGVFSHIKNNIEVQAQIFQAGKQKILIYINVAYGISGFCMFFILCWIIVSLPKTLQVVRINNRVLSLFKMIEKSDITEIIYRCFYFQINHLGQSPIQQAIFEKNLQKFKAEFNQFNRASDVFDQTNLNRSRIAETSSSLILPQNQVQKKKKYFKMDEKNNKYIGSDFQALENDINTQNSWKIKVIITYLCIFCFVSALVLYNFITVALVQKHLDEEESFSNLLFERASYFQEIKILYTQFLMNPGLASEKQSIKDLNQYLINQIYEVEKKLVESSMHNQWHSGLGRYYDTENFCPEMDQFKGYTLYPNDINSMNKEQCEQISNGILQKGIKTAIVNKLEQIRTAISQLTQPELIGTVNVMQTLQKYANAMLAMVAYKYSSHILQELEEESFNFYVINGFMIAFMIVFRRIFWTIFIKKLNESVWNTKGMLNIIPVKIIARNSAMMNEISSGQLQKAVR